MLGDGLRVLGSAQGRERPLSRWRRTKRSRREEWGIKASSTQLRPAPWHDVGSIGTGSDDLADKLSDEARKAHCRRSQTTRVLVTSTPKASNASASHQQVGRGMQALVSPKRRRTSKNRIDIPRERRGPLP